MKLDTFTFARPSFYKKKAEYVYKIKKALYTLERKDLDNDWKNFLSARATLLNRYCNNRSVLDVGCGTGNFLEELRQDYQVKSFVGLDISAAMIAEAKNRYPNGNFRVGSGSKLPFEDNSVDIVTFQWVFHHLEPEIARATLREAIRVSRGEIVIQDTIRHKSGLMYYLSRLYWKMVDGGVNYLTELEWRDFFKDNHLTTLGECHGEIIRTGMYVLKSLN